MKNEEKKQLNDCLESKSGMAYESRMREIRSLSETEAEKIIILDPKNEMTANSKKEELYEEGLVKKYKSQQGFTYALALLLPVLSFVAYGMANGVSDTIAAGFVRPLVQLCGIADILLLLSALCRKRRYLEGFYMGY